MSATVCGSLILAGCKIGAPGSPRRIRPVADGRALPIAFLIGEGSIRCSRPTGLSEPVITPTSSCSVELISACNAGTPIAPVPMKRTRMGALWQNPQRPTARAPLGHCLGHQFLAGGDFALADGRTAAGAEIIEYLPVWQDQEQPLTDRHGGPTLFAVKRRRREIFKLLLLLLVVSVRV